MGIEMDKLPVHYKEKWMRKTACGHKLSSVHLTTTKRYSVTCSVCLRIIAQQEKRKNEYGQQGAS